MAKKTVRVKLIKSKFGRKPGHRACVEGLGLRKIHQTVEVEDTSCNRGMINKVSYLLEVEEK
ncbi:50S ribosomal protein L30 [Candidiatus Paracoxiella cheracis]|uniref:50S ribosomal protein L30 n=1 Tax=Candidiatus Paracoxiella cheracis TaxID=3405120 RepID=UPI003BF52F53